MNKPEWKDAPDWAQWLAMDANGDWYWYELEPDYNGEEWEHIGAVSIAFECPYPGQTLEPHHDA